MFRVRGFTQELRESACFCPPCSRLPITLRRTDTLWGTEIIKNGPCSPVRGPFHRDSEDMPQPSTLYGEGIRGQLTDRTECSQPEIGVEIPEGCTEEVLLLPWSPAVLSTHNPPSLYPLTQPQPSLPSLSGFLPRLAKPFSDPFLPASSGRPCNYSTRSRKFVQGLRFLCWLETEAHPSWLSHMEI